MTTKRKPHKPHWYRMYIGECPVCGTDQSYRERVYGARPEKREDRTVYLSQTNTYDYCMR